MNHENCCLQEAVQAEVLDLENLELYVNIHTTTVPTVRRPIHMYINNPGTHDSKIL